MRRSWWWMTIPSSWSIWSRASGPQDTGWCPPERAAKPRNAVGACGLIWSSPTGGCQGWTGWSCAGASRRTLPSGRSTSFSSRGGRVGLRIRRLQDELARMEWRLATRELAVALGHAINNPLTAIANYLELLERRGGTAIGQDMQNVPREAPREVDRIAGGHSAVGEPPGPAADSLGPGRGHDRVGGRPLNSRTVEHSNRFSGFTGDAD